jgi:chromosome partitioning protein
MSGKMKVISVFSNKGGVSKTTTTINLACALAKQGYKVGLIDFDAQAHLSTDYFEYEANNNLVTCLENNTFISFKDFTEVGDNLWLLPNHEDITEGIFYFLFEGKDKVKQRHFLLAHKLSKLKGFDYVLIDTPPNLENRAISSILAADYLIIPSLLEKQSIDNIKKIVEVVDFYKKEYNIAPEILGVTFGIVDRRRLLMNLSLRNYARHTLPDIKIIDPYIYQSVEYAYSVIAKTPAYFYSNKIKFNFDDLTNNILCLLQNQNS